MARRLILDTNVMIAFERGTIDRSLFDDDELAIAAISVAEFRVGIELASTVEQAAGRARFLDVVTNMVEVLDYTSGTATEHARLLAEVRRNGRPRGAHDLILAAHAVQTGRVIVSRDAAARFGELAGIEAIEV